jgi:hypothetical protein
MALLVLLELSYRHKNLKLHTLLPSHVVVRQVTTKVFIPGRWPLEVFAGL